MEKEEEKKKRGKPRERKANWQEYTATVEEIQAFLDGRVMLRYNVVTRRTECHLLAELTDEMTPEVLWEPISDRVVNTLWRELSAQKPTRIQDMQRVIESDYVPEYDPFRFYLSRLPPWNDDHPDYIMELSLTVKLKGEADEQLFFYECLKKWLVWMVASWMDDAVVNHAMLVLIGRQGSFKTTWFSMLLPPALRSYFYTKTNSGLVSKDDLLTLSQYGLICCEELDSMLPKELNKLKAAMTMPSIDERAAYARYHEHRPHLASFCGTGNNVQFLSDPTGTRRWLPFEVESIASPRDLPFDYEGIYSQAYALYLQDFPYYFSDVETERLKDHNNEYEVSNVEEELIEEYFRLPSEKDAGEFIRTAVAQQIVSSPGVHVSAIGLGRAFSKLGFQRGVQGRSRGYYAVRISPEERKRRAVSQALEARLRKND